MFIINLYSPQFIRYFSTAIILILLLSNGLAIAQKKDKAEFANSEVVRTLDPLFGGRSDKEYYFNFSNINQVFHYYNESEIKAIAKAEKKNTVFEVGPMIEAYVSKFGIKNFYTETDMLWRLGQIYESTAQPFKAKSLYRLVLKHHRRDITQIKRYYDSLTVLDKDYYVPIEYYYKLVEYRKAIDTLRPPRSVFVTMGTEVNSEYPDYGPWVGEEGNLLYFSSRRPSDQLMRSSDENIYLSRQVYGFWDYAEPLHEVNTIYNEGSVTLSPDGRQIVFSRCSAPDGYGDCDLYTAYLNESGKWVNVQNLGSAINGKAWDSHPSFSRGGDTLFFASDRLGGFGLSDIYFSTKENGKWSMAKNCGPTINTRNNEVSPFFHPKYDVLYFSSNGHLVNFGSYDIYKSYFENGHWYEPKNIGPLVNGAGDEYYFTIDKESKYLYYARSEEQSVGDLDLFSFPLPMEGQPLATQTFKGRLTDSLGNPFKGIVSVIDLIDGIEVAPKSLRPDGTFNFDLIDEKKYLLVIQGDEFFRIEQIFLMKGDTNVTFVAENIRNKKLRFASIEFEPGASDILPKMERDLLNVLDFMLDNPNFTLIISGHTDTKGDNKTNLKLSQKRASAIKEYLVSLGNIDTKRISAVGYGDSRPIIKEEQTDEDRQINRRVEFEIIPPKDYQFDYNTYDQFKDNN